MSDRYIEVLGMKKINAKAAEGWRLVGVVGAELGMQWVGIMERPPGPADAVDGVTISQMREELTEAAIQGKIKVRTVGDYSIEEMINMMTDANVVKRWKEAAGWIGDGRG